MRVSRAEWSGLDLRIHALIAGVADLHDAWAVDLPGGPRGLVLTDLKDILGQRVAMSNAVVRGLFQLRRAMGKAFGWEVARAHLDPPPILRDQLTESDRRDSLLPVGTPEGIFRVLYSCPHETAGEIRNATVHAVSSYALVEHDTGYRLYWAVYVMPVGRMTVPYMRLIDPFRRFIIYPALLRAVHAVWMSGFGAVVRTPAN